MVDFALAYRNSDPPIPIPDFNGGVIAEPTEEDTVEFSEEIANQVFDIR
jgi:hypothetical protein